MKLKKWWVIALIIAAFIYNGKFEEKNYRNSRK